MGMFSTAREKLDAPDVLLVDDSDTTAQCVQEYLALLGYSVARARNAHEAWVIFEEACPRAVVTDSNMPGEPFPEESGLRLARRIKHLSPHTPVIMLAGLPPTGASAACDYVLSKPTPLRQLVELLARMGITPH
ncbi:MAG: response regulator [Armatimonadota bacterium]|nr:response regulator [Armatimonadota bacterium]